MEGWDKYHTDQTPKSSDLSPEPQITTSRVQVNTITVWVISTVLLLEKHEDKVVVISTGSIS